MTTHKGHPGQKGLITAVVFTVLAQVAVRAQQFPFDFWHDGKVVLESNDTIRGKIKYDPQNDLLQLEVNSKFETLTSRKVLFYEIFDRSLNNFRQFFALPYSAVGGYRTPMFFELLTEGKITLLSRETLEYRNTSTGYFYGTVSRLVLVYKYFLLKEDGSITAIDGTKNQFIDLMGSNADEVRKFMKTNRLGLERRPDIVRVIAYYNSLQR